MRKISIILLVILGIILISACSKPPKEEMERAYSEVTKAENDADAVAFASSTLVRARDALTRMQNEADAKRYDAAKTYAEEAISLAQTAIAEGKNNSGRSKYEAESLINSLAKPLAETSNALDAAWRTDKIKLDFASLTADMESANRTYNDARQSLQDERYRDAINQGQTVRSLLAGINASLTDGSRAASRKQ